MSTDLYHHISTPPAPGAPLLVTLHGTGGNETQFQELAAQILPEAGLVSPRGDVSEMGAARFFRRTGEGVYDMEDLARATDKMGDFIAAWSAAHPGSPIYAFGYSNGANILASVLMQRPALFARTALLHPLIPWDPDPQPGLAGRRLLITAGENDPICPWPMSERLIGWAKAQGADLTTSTHPGGHEIRPSELTTLAAFLTA